MMMSQLTAIITIIIMMMMLMTEVAARMQTGLKQTQNMKRIANVMA